MSTPLSRVIQSRLAYLDMTKDQLVEQSGLGRSTIFAFIAGTRSDPQGSTLRKLAAGLKMTPGELVELCGGLTPRVKGDGGRTPISIQQRTLAANYERWMAVMGPRMGDREAHDAYWDPHVRTSSQMVDAVETAVGPSPTSPTSTAVSGSHPGAVSEVVSESTDSTNDPDDGSGAPFRVCYRPRSGLVYTLPTTATNQSHLNGVSNLSASAVYGPAPLASRRT